MNETVGFSAAVSQTRDVCTILAVRSPLSEQAGTSMQEKPIQYAINDPAEKHHVTTSRRGHLVCSGFFAFFATGNPVARYDTERTKL